LAAPDPDVLVIGSGAAGLSAALAAAISGARVEVVEATRWFGGTTALSEGMAWIPLSRQARALGLADSHADAEAYLLACGGGQADRARVRTYVRNAAAALAFLEDHSPLAFTLNRQSIDYEPSAPGASRGLRALNPGIFDGKRLSRADFARIRPPLETMMLFGGLAVASGDLPHFLNALRSPRSLAKVAGLVAGYGLQRLAGWPRGTRLANGNGIVAALVHALRARGVVLRSELPLDGLSIADGKVTSASFRGSDGQTVTRPIKGSLVLAAGSFSAVPDLRRRHFGPDFEEGEYLSLVPHDPDSGTVLGIAQAAGAGIDAVAQPALWAPVSRVPMPSGGTSAWPHFTDRQKPGFLIVDERGQRFINEAASYHQFVPQMLSHLARTGTKGAWLIADAAAVRRHGIGAVGPFPIPVGPWLGSGYLQTAETPAALADRLGIPAAAFEQALARFNAMAETGEDADFEKGASPLDRAYGDQSHQPNPCLRPLHGRLYAVRLVAGDIGSFTGLATNATGVVLDQQRRPIRNLYAAGNMAASPNGGAYAAAGLTIGGALVSGTLAGLQAAGADLQSLMFDLAQETLDDQGDVVPQEGRSPEPGGVSPLVAR
jgi:hypothetical protein